MSAPIASDTRSPFNARRAMPEALAATIGAVRAAVVAVSFSAEGFVPIEEVVAMCRARGTTVELLAFDHRRHVGSVIGVHNLRGERVGRPGPRRTTEYIVLAGPADALAAMADAARAVQPSTR